MIVCSNCGFENEADSRFCGGCQEFLEWTGKAVDAEPVALEVVEEPEEEHRGLVERVVDRLRPEDEVADAPIPVGAAAAASGDVAGATTAAADPAVTLAAEAAARAELEAAEAEAQQKEAEERAAAQTQATERARRHAEEAEKARLEAEELARQEAEAAERIRAELEAAQQARQEAEAQLKAEAEAAEKARQEVEARRAEATAVAADTEAQEAEEARQRQEAEQARQEAEAKLQAERDAMEQATAELERAESARKAAEARAQAEAAAAESAAAAAAEAEKSRLAAEEKAKEEARAAEQARRAAALVARPKPTPVVAPTPTGPTGAVAPQPPGTTKPTKSTRPRRRPETTPAGDAQSEPQIMTAATGPTAVKPDKTRVKPTQAKKREAPTRKLRPGDLVCGQCGEGNVPERNFCRRCGNALAEAEVVTSPWYKRIVPKRKPKAYEAGTRPGRGGTKGAKGAVRGAQGLRRKVMGPIGKVTRVLMFVAFAAGLVGITFRPSLRTELMDRAGDVFGSVRQVIAPSFERVAPIGATASSSLGDHPPEHAIDDTSNRWWAEGAEGDGVGESLMVTFAEPVDIAVVGVTPGAADAEEFVAQPRPRTLHLVFDTGVSVDLDVADQREFQTFDVDATGITSVQVQVLEAWPGQAGSDLSITTLEFRTKK